MESLLSIDEAAKALRLSSWTIRAWIGAGKLGSTKLGSRRLVPSSEIERLVAEGTVLPSARQAKTTAHRGRTSERK